MLIFTRRLFNYTFGINIMLTEVAWVSKMFRIALPIALK
jgi:hypothetical protein